jgi:hypothetical protein
MAIPIDQDGRMGKMDSDEVFWRGLSTRVAGGQIRPPSETNLVFLSTFC